MENKSFGKIWKVKNRPYRGRNQGQNQKDQTAQAEVTVYSLNYLFAATLKFKQPKFLQFKYIYRNNSSRKTFNTIAKII
jgi:hypothetical protein